MSRCRKGVKKEEHASPSAVAMARLGTTSDLIRFEVSENNAFLFNLYKVSRLLYTGLL